MNSIGIIEIILVGVIVIIQTTLALRTYRQIKLLRLLIPGLDFLKIKKFSIPMEDLQTFHPIEILKNLSVYINQPEEQSTQVNEVSLVNPNEKSNLIFDEILLVINVYLLRNKGAAADFNLIKDIVERNVETEEDEIGHSVTVPLYLGLMGTMVGIVFGLINIYLVSDINTDFDIKAFLGGVSIAMFASFWGLFCTVANSSFNLKTAKRALEKAKNNFYTFIQIELLPLLNQNVSSSVYTLHQSLIKFNNNFTVNLSELSNMLNKNHDALIAQERILNALESINITEFAKANVKVLKELKLGTEQLEKFSEYLNSLNFLASKTSRLSTSFEDLLSRTNNFQGLAEKLDLRVEESNQLTQFLNDHFQQLNNRSDLIKDSVIKVEDVMIKSLNQLEDHTQIKIEAIKQNSNNVEDFMIKSLNEIQEYTQEKIESIKLISKKEEDLLTQTFAENRSHISKLSLLEDLKKSLEEMKISSAGQIGSIKEEVKSLKTSIEKSNTVLTEINEKTIIRSTPKIAQSIKRFFGAKNKD